MSEFDEYRKREIQLNKFIEWADYEGFETKLSGEFEFSSRETHTAYYAFEAGQQSQQAKIDELQVRVDEALKQLDLAYPESWGCCVEQTIGILKGNKDD